jgi:hypothetical protein
VREEGRGEDGWRELEERNSDLALGWAAATGPRRSAAGGGSRWVGR